jgi:hypothetical protein
MNLHKLETSLPASRTDTQKRTHYSIATELFPALDNPIRQLINCFIGALVSASNALL